MTLTEKRVKIAERMGWALIALPITPHSEPTGIDPNVDGIRLPLPNYFEDLNACAEMVKGLNRIQLQGFYRNLQYVCSVKREGKAPSYLQSYELIHATAAQRAEAIGLTLGLWKE